MPDNNFYYKSFSWTLSGNDLEVNYVFSSGEHTFKPSLVIKEIDRALVTKPNVIIDNLVFNIGLVEMLSYWKAFISPKIMVECGPLDDYQKAWWKDLLINGMGQFFYENNIDFTKEGFIDITSSYTGELNYQKADVESETILIPVGGGKDSAVTLEVLSKKYDVAALVVNPSVASIDTIKEAGTDRIVVERKLDKTLFDLNSQGYPNGHTPFTALLSFISVLVGVLGNYGMVAFSNEKSSDEENVDYKGMKVNHQYSKTLDFENKFREYNQKYLSNINYFSFLRPIYDIQIAKIFSKMTKYHHLIRSCNVGQKEGIWCGKCPKCLSTYILFHPFLGESTADIFGKNLLDDESLRPLLDSLTKEEHVKPFECVGTREELRQALSGKIDDQLMATWGQNNLTPEFEELLKKQL